jgi:rhodanese-related sulfurtransferase
MFKTNGEKALLAVCLITIIFISIAVIGGLGEDAAAGDVTVQSAVFHYFERIPDDLHTINAGELKALLEQKNGIYVLDIRNRGYFVRDHIPGSVNIPFEEVGKNLGKLPDDKIIIVYCYNGQYSGQVAALLNISGYHAKSLSGGWDSWVEKTTIVH